MNKKHERRRCRSCKKLFTADPRCRFHQRFCTEDACQKASKAESQHKYRTKIENLWQHQGEKIFAKLASQPLNGANSARCPNGDEKTLQEAFNWGMMAVVSGSSTQVLIERAYEKVLAVGRELLQNRAVAASRGSARARGPVRRT
jgi:hypothetical protein